MSDKDGSQHKKNTSQLNKSKPLSTVMTPSQIASPKSTISPQSTISGQPSSPTGSKKGVSTYGGQKFKKFSVYTKAKAGSSPKEPEKEKKAHDDKYSADKIGAAAFKIFAKSGYRVLGDLGSGSYARVYKVENKNGKVRAAKVIESGQASKNYQLKFMPRELEILQVLKDSNIIKVYEIIQSKTTVVVIMEFASRGTLTERLKNGPLTEEKAREYFSKIVVALVYLHDKAIAHRDLKLENILLDEKDNPKLTDFSYSIVCQNKQIKDGAVQLSRTFCGTLPYLAPEILQEKEYDPMAADVWSLGVCLYIAMNNALPFKFDDVNSMIKNQLDKKWSFKKRAGEPSGDLKDLLTKMLEPDSKKRIKIKECMMHPWFRQDGEVKSD
ncbi:Testis-specific serine/threonine-protein kinase 1 [Halotydeus destructor]|nr:Testis-specific serine/threonine-protein kinase 1 [Halotydeus destructor]